MYKLIFLFLFVSSTSFAQSPAVRAKVLYTGLWGHTSLFIKLDSVVEEPGCPSDEVWVDQAHPGKQEILSVAMAAAASGKQIGIRTNGCVSGHPIIDTTSLSSIYLRN
jgi:hypothetical protein